MCLGHVTSSSQFLPLRMVILCQCHEHVYILDANKLFYIARGHGRKRDWLRCSICPEKLQNMIKIISEFKFRSFGIDYIILFSYFGDSLAIEPMMELPMEGQMVIFNFNLPTTGITDMSHHSQL